MPISEEILPKFFLGLFALSFIAEFVDDDWRLRRVTG